MEIDNKLIASVVGSALAAVLATGAVGINRTSALEEKKDLKFASFEELCRDQLAACEARYTTSQGQLAECWASK